MTKNLMVSVCMITYKHAPFLKQAIEGVLNQEVNFPLELIIADDNSPDNTEEIVKDFIENHPRGSVIRYVKNVPNKGAIPNFEFCLKQAEGKYIAICEGDDYWTDTLKLKKQVLFLEENDDYVATFHDVVALFEDREVSFKEDRNNVITNPVCLKHLLESDWLIPTCSFLFRSERLILPSFFKDMRFGDFPLFCSVILDSNAYHFENQMGVYRRNNTASLTNDTVLFGKLSLKSDYIQFLNWLRREVSSSNTDFVDNRINKEVEEIRQQIKIYKNSKFMGFYMWLRNIFFSKFS